MAGEEELRQSVKSLENTDTLIKGLLVGALLLRRTSGFARNVSDVFALGATYQLGVRQELIKAHKALREQVELEKPELEVFYGGFFSMPKTANAREQVQEVGSQLGQLAQKASTVVSSLMAKVSN
jgi:hypothetical protein